MSFEANPYHLNTYLEDHGLVWIQHHEKTYEVAAKLTYHPKDGLNLYCTATFKIHPTLKLNAVFEKLGAVLLYPSRLETYDRAPNTPLQNQETIHWPVVPLALLVATHTPAIQANSLQVSFTHLGKIEGAGAGWKDSVPILELPSGFRILRTQDENATPFLKLQSEKPTHLTALLEVLRHIQIFFELIYGIAMPIDTVSVQTKQSLRPQPIMGSTPFLFPKSGGPKSSNEFFIRYPYRYGMSFYHHLHAYLTLCQKGMLRTLRGALGRSDRFGNLPYGRIITVFAALEDLGQTLLKNGTLAEMFQEVVNLYTTERLREAVWQLAPKKLLLKDGMIASVRDLGQSLASLRHVLIHSSKRQIWDLEPDLKQNLKILDNNDHLTELTELLELVCARALWEKVGIDFEMALNMQNSQLAHILRQSPWMPPSLYCAKD